MESVTWVWPAPPVWEVFTTRWQLGLQVQVILPAETCERIMAECETISFKKFSE